MSALLRHTVNPDEATCPPRMIDSLPRLKPTKALTIIFWASCYLLAFPNSFLIIWVHQIWNDRWARISTSSAQGLILRDGYLFRSSSLWPKQWVRCFSHESKNASSASRSLHDLWQHFRFAIPTSITVQQRTASITFLAQHHHAARRCGHSLLC